MSDTSSEDNPKPVIDENPSEEDVWFMRKAEEVSKKSQDESTKVIKLVF